MPREEQPRPARNAWKPPGSHELPAIRDQQVNLLQDPRYQEITAQAIAMGGGGRIMPKIVCVYDEHGRDNGAHTSAQAALMCTAEAARLKPPSPIWHATSDMTSLALAIAKTPPMEPASARRLPSESGFIVFDEPIGGRTAPIRDLTAGVWDLAREDLMITIPVVAAAWSTWTAAEGGSGVRWHRMSPFGVGLPLDESFGGVWINFYTSTRDLYGELDDDEPLWTDVDGATITAAHVRRAEKHGVTPHLDMHTDSVLRWGSRLPSAPRPDSSDEWLNVLYTCFQLLSQKRRRGRAPLLQVEQLPALGGQAGDELGVRVVRVHPDYRPPTAAAAHDAAVSSGRRAGSCEYRWPVPPHRRSVCHNPAGHHLDPEVCERTTHLDSIIMPHVNGPIGKPLRLRPRVRKWDRQPGAPDAG